MLLTMPEIEVLFRVNAFMRDHPGKRHSITFLADTFNIKPRRLMNGYWLIFGQTIRQVQIAQAMLQAATDLREGALVKEAVRKYGYKSRRAFSIAFQQINGRPPESFKSGRVR